MKTLFKPLFFALLAPLFSTTALGQSGGSFSAGFKLSGRGAVGMANSMVQDGEGNMLIATSGGVVVFDGSNTSVVGIGAETIILKYSAVNEKTYVGCLGKIGFIERNNKGKFVFTKIEFPDIEDEEFSGIISFEKDVYFQSDEWVVHVANEKVVGKWKRPNQGNFAGIFNIKNVVFVNVSSSGLYTLLPGGKFRKIEVDDSHIADDLLMFAVTRGANEVLLGTSTEIFLFNGTQLTPRPCEKSSYLERSFIYQGNRIDNNYMVIGTYYGGFLFMDMYNGAVSELYNTGSGFPDNQINCIAVDQAQGVWVNYGDRYYNGYSRVDRTIPVKNFSIYPGLPDFAYSIAETANNVLFVGCADGLYKLKPVENLGELETAIKKTQAQQQAQKENKASTNLPGASNLPDVEGTRAPEINNQPAPDPANPGTEEETIIEKASSRIKGLIRRAKDRIPGNGDKGGNNGGEASPKGGKLSMGNKNITYYQLSKDQSIFKFTALSNNGTQQQYLYSKIAGIPAKVTKILVVPTGLICATATGLYLYTEAGVTKLFEGVISDAMYVAGQLAFIVNGVPYTMNLSGTVSAININPKYKNFTKIFLENPKTLWLGGTNHVLKIDLTDNKTVSNSTLIDIPADYPESVDICRAGETIFFVSGAGLFEYVPASKTAVTAPETMISISEQEILSYAINPAGNTLFVKSTQGWKEVKKHDEMTPVGLMDLLNDVNYVFKTASGNIYALSDHRNVYLLNRTSPASGSFAGFGVFFRGVTGLDKKPYDLSNLSISYKEAAVEIRWGSNLYLKSNGTWYRWRMSGSTNIPWSNWTKETSYKIQLKPGNYTFIVQARDALGNLSPEEKINFSIDPPFYQTWWFYSLLALLLGGIIYLVFIWRNRALIENQKRLEGMVKERTQELGEEKEKTEELLLNILPKAVAQELKDTGKSSVRKHSDSAVMFTDFCNFTLLSKDMTAEQLVEKLDHYFKQFDAVVEKYGLEKIKTIGDAYMCAAGVPQPRKNASMAMVMAALEIIEIVENAETHWKIRVGIHRGGLVSGVVGKKKFAYDIWGDTVNIASRMESSSEPMQINITEQVFNEIKEYFECTKRGEIEAKSLGKTTMYFVTGLKPNYRLNGSNIVPNKEFLSLLN